MRCLLRGILLNSKNIGKFESTSRFSFPISVNILKRLEQIKMSEPIKMKRQLALQNWRWINGARI